MFLRGTLLLVPLVLFASPAFPLSFSIAPHKYRCVYVAAPPMNYVTWEAFLEGGTPPSVSIVVDGPIAKQDLAFSEVVGLEVSKGVHRKGPKHGVHPPYPVAYSVLHKGTIDMSVDSNLEDASVTKKTFEVGADNAGYFRICVYNDVSSWTSKTVQMDFSVGEALDETGHVKHASDYASVNLDLKEFKLNDLKSDKMGGISKSMQQILKTMDSIDEKQREAVHRAALHKQANKQIERRMSVTSFIEISVMVAVGVMQLLLVKRWFAEGNKLGMVDRLADMLV